MENRYNSNQQCSSRNLSHGQRRNERREREHNRRHRSRRNVESPRGFVHRSSSQRRRQIDHRDRSRDRRNRARRNIRSPNHWQSSSQWRSRTPQRNHHWRNRSRHTYTSRDRSRDTSRHRRQHQNRDNYRREAASPRDFSRPGRHHQRRESYRRQSSRDFHRSRERTTHRRSHRSRESFDRRSNTSNTVVGRSQSGHREPAAGRSSARGSGVATTSPTRPLQSDSQDRSTGDSAGQPTTADVDSAEPPTQQTERLVFDIRGSGVATTSPTRSLQSASQDQSTGDSAGQPTTADVDSAEPPTQQTERLVFDIREQTVFDSLPQQADRSSIETSEGDTAALEEEFTSAQPEEVDCQVTETVESLLTTLEEQDICSSVQTEEPQSAGSERSLLTTLEEQDICSSVQTEEPQSAGSERSLLTTLEEQDICSSVQTEEPQSAGSERSSPTAPEIEENCITMQQQNGQQNAENSASHLADAKAMAAQQQPPSTQKVPNGVAPPRNVRPATTAASRPEMTPPIFENFDIAEILLAMPPQRMPNGSAPSAVYRRQQEERRRIARLARRRQFMSLSPTRGQSEFSVDHVDPNTISQQAAVAEMQTAQNGMNPNNALMAGGNPPPTCSQAEQMVSPAVPTTSATPKTRQQRATKKRATTTEQAHAHFKTAKKAQALGQSLPSPSASNANVPNGLMRAQAPPPWIPQGLRRVPAPTPLHNPSQQSASLPPPTVPPAAVPNIPLLPLGLSPLGPFRLPIPQFSAYDNFVLACCNVIVNGAAASNTQMASSNMPSTSNSSSNVVVPNAPVQPASLPVRPIPIHPFRRGEDLRNSIYGAEKFWGGRPISFPPPGSLTPAAVLPHGILQQRTVPSASVQEQRSAGERMMGGVPGSNRTPEEAAFDRMLASRSPHVLAPTPAVNFHSAATFVSIDRPPTAIYVNTPTTLPPSSNYSNVVRGVNLNAPGSSSEQSADGQSTSQQPQNEEAVEDEEGEIDVLN